MPDLTDAEKLRVLAEWLDLEDAKVGRIGNEVQQDLRRIADYLDLRGSGSAERTVREGILGFAPKRAADA